MLSRILSRLQRWSQTTKRRVVEYCGILALSWLVLGIQVFLEVRKKGSLLMLLRGWDSAEYLKALDMWQRGMLDAASYRHGLGMAVLGYVARIGGNPFILWSFVFFGLISALLWFFLRRRFAPLPALGLLLLLLLTFPAAFVYTASLNNMTAYALLLWLVFMLISGEERRLHEGHWLVCGLLAGICFACRYLEPVLYAPFGLALLIREYRKTGWKAAMRGALSTTIACLPWFVFTLYAHASYLGHWARTPYDSKKPFTARVGDVSEGPRHHFSSAHYPADTLRNAYQTMVWAKPYAREKDIAGHKTLLQAMPYLLFSLIGLFGWMMRNRQRWRLLIIPGLTALFNALFYWSFWAHTAHDLKFGCLRYLAGWYYLAGLLAFWGVADLILWFRQKAIRNFGYSALLFSTQLVLLVAFPFVDHAWWNRHRLTNKAAWRISASVYPQLAGRMIDNDPQTFWATPQRMQAGDMIYLDFGQTIRLEELRFNHGDYAEISFPREVRCYTLSQPGARPQRIRKVRSGRQNHIWRLWFRDLTCRYLIVRVAEPERGQWIVYELDAFGFPLP